MEGLKGARKISSGTDAELELLRPLGDAQLAKFAAKRNMQIVVNLIA